MNGQMHTEMHIHMRIRYNMYDRINMHTKKIYNVIHKNSNNILNSMLFSVLYTSE